MKMIFLLLAVTLTAVLGGIPNVENVEESLHHVPDSEQFRNVDHHNKQFDHEAFLGEDQSKTFSNLPPEESRRRLGIIVDKIDTDKDGYVSLVELKDWIRYTQTRYLQEDVDRHWKQYNPENEPTIPWQKYRKIVYGFMDELDSDVKLTRGDGSPLTELTMQKRDRRRWHHADLDEDDALNRTEFSAFLHPEEAPHMRDMVVMETLEDIDKNKDGKVSLEEYIGDIYGEGELESDAEEPDWVKQEREQFAGFRDANNDGHMDFDEVRAWIAPPEFDHAEAEAKHLVFETDQDADEKLTKDEILDKYDLFVGSQATDFGDALVRHDEF